MFDILPFPNITGETQGEQLQQINNYLIQLKESLEFILTSISADNLSSEFRSQLASLGADINTNKTEQDVVNQQIINRSLTVDDVISSSGFTNIIETLEDKIPTDYVSVSDMTDAIEEVRGEIPTNYVDTYELGLAMAEVESKIPSQYIESVTDSDGGIVFEDSKGNDNVLSISLDTSTGYLNYTLVQGE